jgi:hypothetical protein
VSPPFSDVYEEGIDEHSGVFQAITEALLFASLTLWAIFWGAIWLLSGLFVALHLHDDARTDREGARPSKASP